MFEAFVCRKAGRTQRKETVPENNVEAQGLDSKRAGKRAGKGLPPAGRTQQSVASAAASQSATSHPSPVHGLDASDGLGSEDELSTRSRRVRHSLLIGLAQVTTVDSLPTEAPACSVPATRPCTLQKPQDAPTTKSKSSVASDCDHQPGSADDLQVPSDEGAHSKPADVQPGASSAAIKHSSMRITGDGAHDSEECLHLHVGQEIAVCTSHRRSPLPPSEPNARAAPIACHHPEAHDAESSVAATVVLPPLAPPAPGASSLLCKAIPHKLLAKLQQKASESASGRLPKGQPLATLRKRRHTSAQDVTTTASEGSGAAASGSRTKASKRPRTDPSKATSKCEAARASSPAGSDSDFATSPATRDAAGASATVFAAAAVVCTVATVVPKTLPEKLGSRPLRLIIIGHNPSSHAWQSGHYYSHPANRMWPILRKSGIVPETFTPQHDDRVPEECGVGFTDVGTGEPGTISSKFKSEEFVAWKQSLFRRLKAHVADAARTSGCVCGECSAPCIVAFSGKRHYVEICNVGRTGRNKVATVPVGPQSMDSLPQGWPLPRSTEVWVMTSTSGASALTTQAREAPWLELGQRLQGIPWPRLPPSCLTKSSS